MDIGTIKGRPHRGVSKTGGRHRAGYPAERLAPGKLRNTPMNAQPKIAGCSEVPICLGNSAKFNLLPRISIQRLPRHVSEAKIRFWPIWRLSQQKFCAWCPMYEAFSFGGHTQPGEVMESLATPARQAIIPTLSGMENLQAAMVAVSALRSHVSSRFGSTCRAKRSCVSLARGTTALGQAHRTGRPRVAVRVRSRPGYRRCRRRGENVGA